MSPAWYTREKWKPRWKTVVDDKGRKTRERDGRETFWVCDVGDKGLRRQLKISFATPGDTQGGSRDTTQGEGGAVQTL